MILRRIVVQNILNSPIKNSNKICYFFDIILNKTQSEKELYIYGAGECGAQVAKYLNDAGINFNGFIVSDNIDVKKCREMLYKRLNNITPGGFLYSYLSSWGNN